MKIAVFHEVDFGGARIAAEYFASHLSKSNIVDYYYVDSKRNHGEGKNCNKVYYYEFKKKKWTGKNWKAKLYKDTIELYQLYKLHKKIASKINSKKYDIAFIHSSSFTQAPFIIRMLQMPTLYYCQEYLKIGYEKFYDDTESLGIERRLYERAIRKIKKSIDKKNALSATLVLASSKFTKKNIDKAFGIKSKVCYMGVDTKIFKPKKTKKEYDVLFVGSTSEADGYDMYIEAIKKIKKIRTREVLREKEWISSPEEMASIYRKAKVTLCLAYRESFGLIPLESSACGVPVIATSDGGYTETVDEGKNGYLIKRNSEELALTMKKLLSDSSNRERLGSKALNTIKEYWSWQKRTEALFLIMSNIIQEQSHGKS